MNTKTIIAFAAGALVTGSLAFLIAAGPENDEHKGMDHDMDNAMGEKYQDDMMAQMMRLATPNEHHAEMLKSVGNWTAHSSFVMDPAAAPTESDGTMVIESALGGRYIVSHFKMDFMGQPFEGIGYNGYDIAHEQYIATWADSMSTKITYMTGNYDDEGNLVMIGTATTPMGDNPMKIVSKVIDENHTVDKFYDKMPDGTWFNSGTITYTRD
jgi:Protein of unknown function (DUF1579)